MPTKAIGSQPKSRMNEFTKVKVMHSLQDFKYQRAISMRVGNSVGHLMSTKVNEVNEGQRKSTKVNDGQRQATEVIGGQQCNGVRRSSEESEVAGSINICQNSDRQQESTRVNKSQRWKGVER